MELIKAALKERLTPNRFDHVLRVSELAQHLAQKYYVSVHDAEQAALLHDIAKCMDRETLKGYLLASGNNGNLLSFHHELWHGPVGAIIAREEFGVTNKDVLNAVRYHTTGRANMSKLEQIIYVADLIEPGRDFDGIEPLRIAANQSIQQAMEMSIYHTMDYLLSKRVAIYPDTFHCYNEFILNQQ